MLRATASGKSRGRRHRQVVVDVPPTSRLVKQFKVRGGAEAAGPGAAYGTCTMTGSSGQTAPRALGCSPWLQGRSVRCHTAALQVSVAASEACVWERLDRTGCMIRWLYGFLGIALIGSVFSDASTAGQVSGKLECAGAICIVEDLKLTGEIDLPMFEKVLGLLKEAEARTDKSEARTTFADYITLDSPGGSVLAAMAIGRLARQHRLTALVPRGAACVSACVLIYAGAVVRNARTSGGRIGIHAPFLDISGADFSEEAARKAYTSLLQDIRSYFRERLADEMLKTPASQVRFLTVKEQDRLGLVLMDPIEDELISLSEAKRLGISRLEFNRRRALIEKLCPNDDDFVSCADSLYATGKPREPADLSRFGTPVE
jgi:ATP-dependent protease ClpP protease subunit